ncbi:hypothetical protein D3C72_2546320 [compost metagenome]
MPKHSQQQIVRLLDFRVEKIHRFRDGLIDRLVESHHVIQIPGDQLKLVHPQTQHARA